MDEESNKIALRRRDQLKAAQMARDLLLVKGLYEFISDEDEAGKIAEQMIRNGNIGTFDCYCIGCGKETPFIVAKSEIKTTGGAMRSGNGLLSVASPFAVRAVCQRDQKTYLFAFQKIENRTIKIGQMPSLADISFGELKGIDNSLTAGDRKELGKAIGLFAHDAAAGAFVYLRRVFERMILRAHDRRAERDGPIEGFDTMRVDEKIAALKGELPDRAVRNSAVFSVLSAGIHELSDDQCKNLFPVLRAVIFQMLEQEEHNRRQRAAERDTDAAFQALLSSNSGKASAAEPEDVPVEAAAK